MANPRVSILLPVRNAAPYLDACLTSIQDQTLSDWEILAVNDHSTDHSLEVLRGYAARDPRIRVFDQEAVGIIPALQRAFAAAQGPFITRMDADDRMAPEKLAALTEIVAQNPRAVATGLVAYFSDGELGEGFRRYAAWLNAFAAKNNHYQGLYRECPIASPCWMVTKQALSDLGAFSHSQYPEDYDLVFRFRQAGLQPQAVRRVLHHWRDHPERASRTDPHYRDHRFFALKVGWWHTLDYDPDRPLVLWGAGKNGKDLARELQRATRSFRWVCNNPRKHGHQVLGVTWQAPELIKRLERPQILIAVAAPAEQATIKRFLERLPDADAYFFS